VLFYLHLGFECFYGRTFTSASHTSTLNFLSKPVTPHLQSRRIADGDRLDLYIKCRNVERSEEVSRSAVWSASEGQEDAFNRLGPADEKSD